MVLYEVSDFHSFNRAFVFWKTKTRSGCYALYQPVNFGDIKKKAINDPIFKSVNFNNVYQILQDDIVRTMDTTGYVSHVNWIYCEFYFGSLRKIQVSYQNDLLERADQKFGREYTNESINLK
jgi:hypothetical protein